MIFCVALLHCGFWFCAVAVCCCPSFARQQRPYSTHLAYRKYRNTFGPRPRIYRINYQYRIFVALRISFLALKSVDARNPSFEALASQQPTSKSFRIWPPCTTRYFGASSGLQRSAPELYRFISPGSLESSDLGVAPRHTRSAGLTIWDCQSLSYDNTNWTITLS